MKKFITVFTLFFAGFSIMAQTPELDYYYDNKVVPISLKSLKLQGGSTASVTVPDINLPSNPNGVFSFTDLSYNVYVRLYNVKNDATVPTLRSKVTLPISLSVSGSGSSTNVTIPTQNITVSSIEDKSVLAYHFGKNQVSPFNYNQLQSATLSFPRNLLDQFADHELENVFIELHVDIARYETGTRPLNVKIESNLSGLRTNEALISWQSQAKPCLYEVEWVYNQGYSSPSFRVPFNFNEDAIRVQTRNNYYPISIFKSSGYYIARVRTLRPRVNDDESAILNGYEYGPWSLIDVGQINYSNLPSHAIDVSASNIDPTNSELNWQFKSVFARDGKKKESIVYYDGSNRTRQSITANTDSKTRNISGFGNIENSATVLAQESYYNYNGEPVVDMLPAPIPGQNIPLAYQLGLNKYGSSKPLKSDYDEVGSNLQGFSTSGPGASRYYSSNNQFLPLPNHGNEKNFIPDAGGYPYTKKVLMKDGSGRVKAVYQVGNVFGAHVDRNTKFFYATPMQSELNSLFGTNVGDASFYKKNITIDGNGVISMAYVDIADKTIATSIAGKIDPSEESKLLNAPSDITSNYGLTFEENLLENGRDVFIESENTLEVKSSIFVPIENDYYFQYGLDLQAFYPSCFGGGIGFCFSCKYNYSFKILDEEGNLILAAKKQDITLDNVNCNATSYLFTTADIIQQDPAYSIAQDGNSVKVKLKSEKNYSVIKRLEINTDNIEAASNTFLNNQACIGTSLEIMIQEELDSYASNADWQCTSEFDDPCASVRDSIRGDFRYPYGAIVSHFDAEDEAVENILNVLTTFVNLPSGKSVSSIKQDFLLEFNLTEFPTFAEFDDGYLEFFIEFHPSYNKLLICESLNSQESIRFDKVLQSSATVNEFLTNLNSNGSITFDATNELITTHLSGQDVSNEFALFAFDQTMRNFQQGNLTHSFNEMFTKDLGAPAGCDYYTDLNGWMQTPGRTCLGYVGSCVYPRIDLIEFQESYFNGDGDCRQTAANRLGIMDIIFDISMSTDQRWNMYKGLYANGKHLFIDEIIAYSTSPLLKTFDCSSLSPELQYVCANYFNGDRSNSTNQFLNAEDPQTGIFSWTQTERSKILNDLEEELILLIKSTFSSGCLQANWESVVRDISNNEATFFADPFIYFTSSSRTAKSTIFRSVSHNCFHDLTIVNDVYDLNLGTVLSPYFQYAKDEQGNPLFGIARDPYPRVNCADFQALTTQFDSYLTNVPVGINIYLAKPLLPNGYDDLDPSNEDQERFANWMNYELGLNFSFRDYFELSQTCTSDGVSTYFTNVADHSDFSVKAKAIKEGIKQFSSTASNYFESATLVADINSSISNATYHLNSNDFIGAGTVDHGGSQRDLFLLENKAATFQSLLTNMDQVFRSIRTDLISLGDFENSFTSKTELINLSSNNVIGSSLTMDRAVRYSNGTIWVRLLDSNGDYYDDYYFHYTPHNYAVDFENSYKLSELGNSNTNMTSFTNIVPVFHDVAVKYVKLIDANGNSILASTSSVLETAVNLGLFELNSIEGMPVLPKRKVCEDYMYEYAKANAKVRYDELLKEKKQNFVSSFSNFCFNQNGQNGFNQNYSVKYINDERQFTLYYYDQAGNLVMTVPPEGVNESFRSSYVASSSTDKQLIDNYRNKISNTPHAPVHSKITKYKYNADNQIIKQETPDGGISLFWYDKEGRLVLSQNEKQRNDQLFSYSLYDEESRIIESGQVELLNLMYATGSGTTADDIWVNVNATVITERLANDPSIEYILEDEIALVERVHVNRVFYDNALSGLAHPLPSNFSQDNLRSRIVTHAYFSSTLNNDWQYATHYSYDAVGNVKTILKDFYQNQTITNETHRFKRIDYGFDPVSGNVVRVSYQKGEGDSFYHEYDYDSENRIIAAKTSRDGIIWDEDARYNYYLHGPLARTELGENHVQGLDYIYTINGWLKSVNGSNHNADAGADMLRVGVMSEDAFGYSLQYFDGDYQPITAQSNLLLDHPNTVLPNLYNGNIAGRTIHMQGNTFGKVYKYDQLSRIKESNEYQLNLTTKSWTSNTLQSANWTAYTYDKDGNITDLDRFSGDDDNGTQTMMDELEYNYDPLNNQLTYVEDAVAANDFDNDIDLQLIGNYTYDDIGNLKSDRAEGIKEIYWYPNGKVKKIERIDAPTKLKPELFFEYDESGNRVKKVVQFIENGLDYNKTTYYIRDAQGNVMATYDERDCTYDNDPNDPVFNYYQYSKPYSYYSSLAENLTSKTILLNFLKDNLSLNSELLANAEITTPNVANIRSLIFSQLNVPNYVALYTDAAGRVIAEDAYFYANDLHTNQLSSFTPLMNDWNEVWIQYLRNNNQIVSFYNSFSNLYTTHLSSTEQLENVTNVLLLDRFALNEIEANDVSQFKSMLYLTTDQYEDVKYLMDNPSKATSFVKDYVWNLQDLLFQQVDNGETMSLIKKINASFAVISEEHLKVEDVFDGIEISAFYDAFNWLNPGRVKLLNSALHHANAFASLEGVSSPVEVSSLLDYEPTTGGVKWDEDVNGDYLDNFIKKDVANQNIESVSSNYFTGLNFSAANLYFLNGVNSVRPYVHNAMQRHNTNSLLVNSVTGNQAHSATILANTESTPHLAHYLRIHHPYNTLLYNYDHDALQGAFTGLLNYSPFTYSEELELGLSIVLSNPATCSTLGNKTLTATSYDLYGSSRLGVMDAKVSSRNELNSYTRKLGAKTYELSDHLGNVLATVSDKKLHPEELVVAGSQSVDPTLGFQADVTGTYDYYPFGMEIQNRSGDFSKVDYSTDTYEILYDGLLDCSDYRTNGDVNKDCDIQTNPLYNNNYLSSISFDQASNSSYIIYADLTVASLIPYLTSNGEYTIQLTMSGTAERPVSASIGGTAAIVTCGAGNCNSASQVTASGDKIITFMVDGAFIINQTSNGIITVQINVNMATGFFHSLSSTINQVKITETFNNTLISLAQRDEAAYKYGFNGMERDDEMKGSGNSYTTHYRLNDVRLGKWFSVDPKANLMPWQSSYNSMDNNPISKTDPKGDCPSCIFGALIGAAVDYGVQVAANAVKNGELSTEAFTQDISLSSIVVSAGEGFLTSGASAGKTLLVKTTAAVVKNTVQVRTTVDGVSVNVETNTGTIAKNAAVDLTVGAVVKKASKVPTSAVNKGEVVKNVKKVYKAADINVTRKLNQGTKEAVDKVVDKVVPKTIETAGKVLTKDLKTKVKQKTTPREPVVF